MNKIEKAERFSSVFFMLRINYLTFIVKIRLTVMLLTRYNLEKKGEIVDEAKTVTKNELFPPYYA